MYTLLAIDSVVRIAFAMAVLFLLVPRLAGIGARAEGALRPFWFDLAWGVVILTIGGQILTLLKLYSLPTLLLLCALVILIARSVLMHRSPFALLAATKRWLTLAMINLLERRVSVRRRVRRGWRRLLASTRISAVGAAWMAMGAVAGVFRLYRPFATANLGYSDSYVHLYLVKLLDQGRQVDPAWGPYPRGMHFLLLAIQRLTNIDEILLVNFFGAVVGVLLTLAVAWTARELASSNAAGILAGLLFATMVGGASQYFILGGSFETRDLSWARAMSHEAYARVPRTIGEFDVLLTAFQRQASTLSQEMAIVFLFPAAVFLLGWFRGEQKSKWGFIGCTAAIAATHSGVLIPLVLLCAIVATQAASARHVIRGALFGLYGILLGSTWLLGFIAYPLVTPGTHPGATALFYFPFLRHFAGDAAGGTSEQQIEAYNTITWFLLAMLVVAVVLLVLRAKRPLSIAPLIFLIFFIIHISSRYHLPQLVESRRNSEWFLMSIAMLIGIALAQLPRPLQALAMCVWLIRVPWPGALRDQMLNYSGYGSASLAVVEIAHKYEPFTWTLVSYGQEYPMVLGRGFHITASEFLNHYDPASRDLAIPTRYVFVLTERIPHRFEVRDWQTKFSRSEIESRLETWCQLYRATHDDLRLFLDDGNVQVYEIARSQEVANRIATEARIR